MRADGLFMLVVSPLNMYTHNHVYTVETFETMDESFGELAKLLQFRDKEQERMEKSQKKKMGTLSQEDVEMDAWDKEMKVCFGFVKLIL